MIQKKMALLTALIISISFAVCSCGGAVRYTTTSGSVYKGKQTGPPPHAPAHGYRYKHSEGVDLIYQSKLGVYLVAGSTDLYFQNNRFYRLHNNLWQASAHVDGPWKPVKEKKLPLGLQKQKQNKNKHAKHAMK